MPRQIPSPLRPARRLDARHLGILALLCLAALSGAPGAVAQGTPPTKGHAAAIVGRDGAIALPKDYRTGWEYLGSFAGLADDRNGSKEMHTVYASPGTIAAYRRTGAYPEGTVLVKEVLDTATEDLTTGRISYATTVKGWFVMVKASGTPFPGNKLWGDGWGWAFYENGPTPKLTTTDYAADCLACHEPVRATDLSYVQGYPPLRK